MKRAVITLLIVALAVFGAMTSKIALAQTPVPQQSRLVAIGMGKASAPAATATLQFLLGSSMMYGMGPMYGTESAPMGSPESGEQTVPNMSGAISDASLQPVVEALTEAGVSADAVTIAVPAATDAFSPGGSVGEILVVIDQPADGALRDIVRAVRRSAAPSGLEVLHVGASFTPADCAVLFQAAREAAIADAQARVEGLAVSLGGTLGALIEASESPGYGPYGVSSCDLFSQSSGPFGMNSLPSFDPKTTEATAYVQVTLTYAFEVNQ